MPKIALTLSIVDGDSEDCLTLTLDKEEVKELFELFSSKHWIREHTEHPEAEYARRLADTVLGYANWSPNAIQEWLGYNDYCSECGVLIHSDEQEKCYRHNDAIEDAELVDPENE
mgnify:CR=1 FL=1